MFELSKESAVKEVLKKRFGKDQPEDVEELAEINLCYAADGEINNLGINVELKFDAAPTENYQVSTDGIVYSWGDSPIIDERSQHVKLSLETVYSNMPYEDELIDDDIE
jgi:hypothetical protein